MPPSLKATDGLSKGSFRIPTFSLMLLYSVSILLMTPVKTRNRCYMTLPSAEKATSRHSALSADAHGQHCPLHVQTCHHSPPPTSSSGINHRPQSYYVGIVIELQHGKRIRDHHSIDIPLDGNLLLLSNLNASHPGTPRFHFSPTLPWTSTRVWCRMRGRLGPEMPAQSLDTSIFRFRA